MKDTRAVQQIAQEQREHIIDSGIVRAIRGQYIDVLLDGTRKLVRNVIVSKSITSINTGWWVVIARVPRTNKWVALSALESISTGSTAESSDLAAPANVTATAKPYLIELSWSGSFRKVATYEVQHNSSASETGATMLKVEGSNFFYWCAPGTQRYFRVRAVSSAFERSAWSSWVNATATTGAAYMFLGVDAAGTAPIWTAFDWDNVTGVAGADMVHDHSSNAEGGQNLLSLVELSFNASTELTISGGSVTRTQVFHTIDTENDDPSDDLDTIAGGADGKLIIIRPADDARTVVVKHNTGNIWLSGVADITLNDAGDALVLLYVNALTKWVDIGWSAGGAGGGAPTNAQYLVLALDDTLIAERRFVPGDGLQAVDGGADGDYTLNIDVSDFAGTGLEDDGAENLRIAAAAAGDGLQGGGGDALAVDNTVVRTSGNQTIADVKTFSGNIILDDGVGDSPQIQLVGGSNDDTALIFLADDAVAARSDLVLRLPGNSTFSELQVQASDGTPWFNVWAGGISSIGTIGGTIISGSGGVRGYLTGDDGPAGQFQLTSATADSVKIVGLLTHLGGAIAAGFGGRLLYRLKDAGGNTDDAACIDAIWDDPADTSEDSRIAFGVRVGGAALAEMCRIDGTGLVMVQNKLVDLQGGADALVLDDDGDTTISAPTPNQIDFEVGNADILHLVPTALKSQGSTFPDLGTTTLAEKLGNVYLGTAKDVYPMDDEAGLGQRRNNWLSVDDHFGGAAFGAAWGWAGAPFATPGYISFAYNSLVYLGFDAGATPKGFLARTDELTASLTGILVVSQSFTDGSYVGVRHDDGSDNNYVETAIRKTTGVNTLELIVQYRTGGGGVTTAVKQTIYDFPMWVFVGTQLTGTKWTSWGFSANYGINSPALNAYGSGASGLSWTPTRKGIIFYSSENPPAAWRGPYIDFYHSSG